VTHTYVPRRKIAVDEYLRGQGRYQHLFEPVRNDAAIAKIQEQVDRYWSSVHETTGAAR
jgi:pyruvate ferredoxin oxidoreductase beta subunit